MAPEPPIQQMERVIEHPQPLCVHAGGPTFRPFFPKPKRKLERHAVVSRERAVHEWVPLGRPGVLWACLMYCFLTHSVWHLTDSQKYLSI